MKLYLEVEKFGRIDNAKICLSGLTLFVGDNNSGKSYIMQLAHGLFRYLSMISNITNLADDIYEEDLHEDATTYTLDASAVQKILDRLNGNLAIAKEHIIRYIFNSDIPIGSLRLTIENFDDEYYIKTEPSPDTKSFLYRVSKKDSSFNLTYGVASNISKREGFSYCAAIVFFSLILGICSWGNIYNCKSIFLPSSRTGLLLLYRQFFSNSRYVNMMVHGDVNNNSLNLPLPTMDFMEFLQTYQSSNTKPNTDLLSFIYNNLADGTISMGLNDMQYQPKGLDLVVQMPLCSSMINELTPIVQVLTSTKTYNYIMYDEVETCLHPMKQIQMARFLIRLANTGTNLLVSTHSDTMALALNNLFLLSYSHRINRDQILQKLGYTKEDLLTIDEPHVYQFSREGNRTVVSELEMSLNPHIGFSFEQFGKSSDKIFTDANEIMRG